MIPPVIRAGSGAGEPNIDPEFIKRLGGLVLVLFHRACRAIEVLMEHACAGDLEHSVFKRSDIHAMFGRALRFATIPFFTSEGLEPELAAMRERMDVVDTEMDEEEEMDDGGDDDGDDGDDGDGGDGDSDDDGDGDDDDDDARDVEDTSGDNEWDEAPEHLRVDLASTTCECETCAGIRGIDDAWTAWNPTDEVELYLKEHIDDLMVTMRA
jgi:hypothetical protein